MAKKKKRTAPEALRLAPEKRLAAKFDAYSIARYPLPAPDEMGVRVVDNAAEEHMQ
ncbi:MAG: hypothetical protein ACSW8F_01070 [bacterium]